MIQKYTAALAFICITLLSFNTVVAQDDSITLIPERSTSFVGQEVIVSIVVIAEELVDEPEFPEIENANVHFVDSQVTPNQQKKAYEFRYSCLPLKAGMLVIPAVSMTINDVQLTSSASQIEVLQLMTTDKLKLTTTISSNSLYIGQPATL